MKKSNSTKAKNNPKNNITPQKTKRHYIGGLCKVGKYYWICVKRNGKKIEKSTGCTDRKSAEVVLAKYRAQTGHAKHGIISRGPFDILSLEIAAREWHEAKKGHVSERYREQMLETVLTHMEPWKRLPISDISSDVMAKAVHRYQNTSGRKILKGKLIETTHSTGGSNRLIRLISALYGWLIKTKQIIEAKPWSCQEEKIQKEPRSIVWPEEVKRFLEATDQSTESKNIRLSVRMQIGLGLRETETSTADWRWFTRRHADGRDAVYCPGKTKNKETREIPVPAWLFKLLMNEWEEQGRPTKGLILRYREADEPIYRGFTKNAIASAGTKIGIEDLHPHRMRATFATAHFEDGTNVGTISEMLGHKHESTTYRYIERRSKNAREAQDRVAKTMGF